jgi:Pyridoxamine 5'-phosphate oxidase
MGKVYEGISDHQREWIARQPLFFVGSAPLDGDGHVNVSPKGPIGSLRVLDDHTVAYLDVVGSGAETIAHIRENGRVVVMLCAFEGPPRIVRLHGTGTVCERGEDGFDARLERFGLPTERRGLVRSVVDVEVARIADSCGFGVPRMAYEGERDQLPRWAETQERKHGPDALRAYEQKVNLRSIDGLPGVAEAV